MNRVEKHVDNRIHYQFDEINRAYAELVKKYKEINKERNELMITVEDLVRANKMIQ
jgi:hypothetical protein